MTYISLRKTRTPAPDSAAEDVAEDVEAEADDDGETTEHEPEGAVLGPVRALYQGACNWCSWCSSRIGTGLTIGGHAVAFYAAAHYNSWVTFGVLVPLGVTIARFAPKESLEHYAARLEARDKAREERRLARFGPPVGEAGAAPAEAEEEPPGDPLVTLMWRLIADASGVHVKTLAEVLTRVAEKEGQKAPSRADVEASLEDRGVPLRDSVRDARGKVNKGVHRDDLQAWEEALSQSETAPPIETRSSDVATP